MRETIMHEIFNSVLAKPSVFKLLLSKTPYASNILSLNSESFTSTGAPFINTPHLAAYA